MLPVFTPVLVISIALTFVISFASIAVSSSDFVQPITIKNAKMIPKNLTIPPKIKRGEANFPPIGLKDRHFSFDIEQVRFLHIEDSFPVGIADMDDH